MTDLQYVHVLIAEDDPDDRLLVRRAFQSALPRSSIAMVADGEELLDYLHMRGKYGDPVECPRPSLIMLDLNMPRKDGLQVLQELKSMSEFRKIPVVVLTTSASERDIALSYELGVNAFISKPASFSKLKKMVRSLSDFWFDVVKLPPAGALPAF